MFGVLFIDLFIKTQNCICHDLLKTNLSTYRLSFQAPKLLYDDLRNRNQISKIVLSENFWDDTYLGISQRPFQDFLGSILRTFIIQHLYLLLALKHADLKSYVADNTPYVITNDISKVFSELEITAEKLFRWYAENQMKAIMRNVTVIVNVN